MKLTTLFISILLIACTSKDVSPTTIIGKWAPTYITQTKQVDGTFDAWHTINTFVALPVYEFTSDGQFLRDGKSGAQCCSAGNNFTVSGSVISFSDFYSCPRSLNPCKECTNWTIIEIKSDTLILEECNVRNKYLKIK